jgi:hypothetical protein
MSNFPLWAAIRTVKSKIGTWVGYEMFKEAYPDLDRDEWATAVGQARAALINRVDEMTKPLNRRPVGLEVKPLDSKVAKGYIQQVDVFVMDRETGLIDTRFFTVRGDTLRSRQAIINMTRDKYQAAIDANPDDYPEEIVGIAYVGSYLLRPGN